MQIIRNIKHLTIKVIDYFFHKYISYSISKIKNKNVTIICNNCIAGIIYKDFDTLFLSPTINLYFYADDYLGFLENFDNLLQQPIIWGYTSKHFNPKSSYPIGKIEQIEIHFLHYKSIDDAEKKWEERKSRINFNNIVVIGSDRDMNNRQEITKRFAKIRFAKKVFFSSKRIEQYNFVYFPQYEKQACVGDLIQDNKSWYFHFNFHKFINTGKIESNLCIRNIFILLCFIKEKCSQ